MNDKALQFLDIHPQPILVEENWIYFVDTGKYSRQPWGCPYIGKVKKLFVENYHDTQVYVLTDERILKVNVKTKDNKDLSKKGLCSIEKSIPYFDPFIKQKYFFNMKIEKLMILRFLSTKISYFWTILCTT